VVRHCALPSQVLLYFCRFRKMQPIAARMFVLALSHAVFPDRRGDRSCVGIRHANAAGVSRMNESSCLWSMFSQLLNGRSASIDAPSVARESRKIHKLQAFCDATGNSASSRRKCVEPKAAAVSQRNSEDGKPRNIVVKTWKADVRIRFPTSSRRLSCDLATIATGSSPACSSPALPSSTYRAIQSSRSE